MDGPVDDGFIVLGGPIGEGDGENTLLILEADSGDAVREHLSADPWCESILRLDSIRPWSIWLRR